MDTEQMPPPLVPPAGKSQPISVIDVDTSPMLDDNAVREAIMQAEANNQDPMTIKTNELSQGPVPVPDKFKTPNGEVDVDKIKTSTQALDEAIQKKEEAISRTVDDYMREYNDRQTKFRNMPNPDKLAASVPPIASPIQDPNPNYEDIVRRDYAADPLGTTARLMDLMIQRKFQPLEQREKDDATRNNLQALAAKDPRILDEKVFAAVNAKLRNDPDLWNLKNPHKAAWLEVKEELRLGELPQGTPAQPRLSPVLGGGTPPSTPLTTVPSQQNSIASLATLDLRDKKQEEAGDELVRRALMENR